eukprot:4775858-Prymnesium_polylepis.1
MPTDRPLLDLTRILLLLGGSTSAISSMGMCMCMFMWPALVASPPLGVGLPPLPATAAATPAPADSDPPSAHPRRERRPG